FCMFGVHLEKGANRFQKLYHRDRRMWDTAINKLGLKKPLDLIDVKYIPDDVEVSHVN
ncbi:class V aminotransferase, partial [Pseudoalteromonas aurantia]